jgi:hypothetical protein
MLAYYQQQLRFATPNYSESKSPVATVLPAIKSELPSINFVDFQWHRRFSLFLLTNIIYPLITVRQVNFQASPIAIAN